MLADMTNIQGIPISLYHHATGSGIDDDDHNDGDYCILIEVLGRDCEGINGSWVVSGVDGGQGGLEVSEGSLVGLARISGSQVGSLES